MHVQSLQMAVTGVRMTGLPPRYLDCFLQAFAQPTKLQVSPPVLKQQQQLIALVSASASIGLQQQATRFTLTVATHCSTLQRAVLFIIQLKPML